ncbi:MAG: hypothetical protein ABMA01_14775 [Chthoniobacteraceae bacterium]
MNGLGVAALRNQHLTRPGKRSGHIATTLHQRKRRNKCAVVEQLISGENRATQPGKAAFRSAHVEKLGPRGDDSASFSRMDVPPRGTPGNRQGIAAVGRRGGTFDKQFGLEVSKRPIPAAFNGSFISFRSSGNDMLQAESGLLAFCERFNKK